jgi:hypothetical protein
MIKLFFDIETLPSSDESKEKHLELLRERGVNKKIAASEEKDLALHEGTSFNGNFGRIACIGYIKENGQVEKECLSGDEKDILTKFWEIARDVDLFVGHNVLEFDFPFIIKRSIIHKIKPSLKINFAKYRSDPIFDTMKEWDSWAYKQATSLDTLAKIFDLPTSKGEMDGSQVAQAYLDGRIQDICDYCMKDVELTRQVYYRMVFEDIPQ